MSYNIYKGRPRNPSFELNPLGFDLKENCCTNSISSSLFTKEITTCCVKLLLIQHIVCILASPSRLYTWIIKEICLIKIKFQKYNATYNCFIFTLQISNYIIYHLFINKLSNKCAYMSWNETKNFNKNMNSAVSIYEKGASLENIAKYFNVLRGTVKYHFNKNNVK